MGHDYISLRSNNNIVGYDIRVFASNQILGLLIQKIIINNNDPNNRNNPMKGLRE
jgi:hypothetical protein